MPKVEVEIKAQLEKEVFEAFESRSTRSSYNSKTEWLREKVRDFPIKIGKNSRISIFWLLDS